jgi:hypothetical protein
MAENISTNSQQKETIRTVVYSYLKWFLAAAFLATIGASSAYYLNAFSPLSDFQVRMLQIFSPVLEAASLGQCGYSYIQTWGTSSPAEKLNQKLFTIFSAIGFFLITFAFQLEAPAA